MPPRTTAILYWTLTILFCLMALMDGVAGILQVKDGQEAMRQLGYPTYIMSICGAAKIFGALALLQPRYRTLKEWAFAGFTINFLGAAASWVLAGHGLAMALPALVMLAGLAGLYLLWKKHRPAARPAAALPTDVPAYTISSVLAS